MSFIDTTLPPGYCFMLDQLSDTVPLPDGWACGDESRYVALDDVPRICRSAWRHWTASVLKGREILWYRTAHGVLRCIFMGVEIEGCVLRWTDHRHAVSGSAVYLFGEEVYWSSDIDCAMVAFASHVLAREGMPA